jgi:hypothetical protein
MLVAFGLSSRGSRARGVILIALLVVVSSGVSLLLADALLFALRPEANAPFEPQGMLQADPAVDYALTPGWRGTFEDDHGSGEIRINSLGHRDGEPLPAAPGVERVLLLGDSFTFGNRLGQSDTIDAWIEKLSDGRVDAYNAGVAGYSPPNILAAYERLGALPASHVYYLFFQNDLLSSHQALGGQTVVDGWLVHTHKPDGSRYGADELRDRVARAWKSTEFDVRAFVRETLGLVHLREAVVRVLDANRRLSDSPPAAFSLEAVDQARATTERMRELARSRGAEFGVVVIPSKDEISGGAYFSFTKAYLDALRGSGVEVIELFDALGPDDYIPNDGHFSASGARTTARVILSAVGEPR